MDRLFKVVFLTGLVVGSVTRTHYGRQYRQNTVTDQRPEGGLTLFLLWLWGVAQILGLVYVFSSWLNFANCHFQVAGWRYGNDYFWGSQLAAVALPRGSGA